MDKDGIQGSNPFLNTELCEGVEDGGFPCNNVENIYELDTLMVSTTVTMPEPGTLGLLGVGLLALGFGAARRSNAAQ